MSVTDSRLCFERHATSKNTSSRRFISLNTKVLEEKHLPLLLQIAHVEMKTKQDQEELGTKLLLRGVSLFLKK
jgi:DNA mismatch repair protein MutL